MNGFRKKYRRAVQGAKSLVPVSSVKWGLAQHAVFLKRHDIAPRFAPRV